MEFAEEHKEFILQKFNEHISFVQISRDLLREYSYFDDFSLRTIRRHVSDFLNDRQLKNKNSIVQGTHVVFGCVHAPFHNKKFMEGALKLISDLPIKGIHLIGDFLDNNSLSSHDRGKAPLPGVTLSWEYDQSNILLDKIDSVLGDKVVKNYLWGNHEDRYKRHMKSIDSSKYGDSLIGPNEGLKLAERGYTIYDDWVNDTIKLGNHLELMHGEYCCIHTAKKHLDTFRGSVMFAHTHRQQTYIEGNSAAYNIGFMGDKKSGVFNYAKKSMKTKWSNAFALVDIDEDGYFHVTIISFFNDRFYYNGKKY